jgi:hypothetical protein
MEMVTFFAYTKMKENFKKGKVLREQRLKKYETMKALKKNITGNK